MNVFVNIKLMCVVKEGNFFFYLIYLIFIHLFFWGEGVFSYAAMFLFDSFSHFKKLFFLIYFLKFIQ